MNEKHFNHKIVFVLLAVMMLSGCSSGSPTASPTPVASSRLIPSGTHTVALTTTPSPTIPTPTFTPSATPLPSQTLTMTLIPGLTIQCVEISAEVPLPSVTNSGVVLMTPLDSAPYLLNLSTSTRYSIPLTHPDIHSVYSGKVSPDGNSLAYIERFDNQESERIIGLLRIVTADGQIKAINNFEKYWTWWRWLDNDRLEIYWWDAPNPGTVILMNPFTGQRVDLTPTFPNLYNDTFNPAVWRVIYSPDLERVLYLSNADQYLGKAVLWDIVTGNTVWQYSEAGVGTISQIPAWSPLGDQVAVVVGNHLFRVNYSGLATQLADIGQNEVGRFSWSPDGSHIAFWASSHHGKTRNLFILDTISNQVVDLCLDTASAEGNPPLWSPDGLQFIFRRAVENVDGSLRDEAILVDIDKGIANLIPNDEVPTAWMRSMP